MPAASASRMGPQVSLVRRVFATTPSQSLGDRGCARPRPGPPWRGHGPIGDPLCGAGMRASTSSGYEYVDLRKRRDGRGRGDGLQATSRPGFCPRSRTRRERIARSSPGRAREDSVPVVLGGDHSVALGTLAGLAEVHGPGGTIWIDAHGDLNSPDTSPSGNVHGMVLAAALGLAGDRFRGDGWGLPALDARPRRARRSPLAGRRRAGAAPQARREGVHDERRRPPRHRACDSRVADARRRPGLRPRESRHGCDRSRRGTGRRDAGARRSVLPRGAPRHGARRGVGARVVARRRRGEPDARPGERDGKLAVELVASALGARISESAGSRNRSIASAVSSYASQYTMCPPGTSTTLDQVAERRPVRVDLFFAHEPELAGVDEQRRDAQASRPAAVVCGAPRTSRRRRSGNSACAKRPSGCCTQMLAHLLLEDARAASAHRSSSRVRDRFLGRCEGVDRHARVPRSRSRRAAGAGSQGRATLRARLVPGEGGELEQRDGRRTNGRPSAHSGRRAASSVSSTSCAWVAIVHGGSQPELPCPRRSGARTRKRSASRSSASLRKRRP